MRLWTYASLLAVVLLVGCAEEIRGPDASLASSAPPGVACNASNEENANIVTRVVLRAATDAGAFSPLPVNVIAGDAGIELPRVTLSKPGTPPVQVDVRQTQFVSNTEMHIWITRTTANGRPLEPGTYSITVTNPNGSSATLNNALRIVPPPVLERAERLDPPVPMTPADPNEYRTVCNAEDVRLALRGQNFRPADPTPIVQLVDAMGNEVRRILDDDVRVISETEIQITLRGATDPSMRLAPGTYGFRVINPDGEPLPGYPNGCRSTRTDLITVVPPPEITSVEPEAVCASRMNTFTIRGRYFRRGATVTIQSMPAYEVPPANITVTSSTGSSTEFDTVRITVPAGAVPAGGPYRVTVRNPDGCAVSFGPACRAGTMPTMNANECSGPVGPGGATVTGPQAMTFFPDPTITAVMPMALCAPGVMQMVTITGTGFHATYGVQPTVTIDGVMLTNVRVTSPTSLTGTVPAPGLMAGGPYNVTVTLPEGCGVTRTMALTVNPGPTLSTILPSRGWNMIDMPVTILGDGFVGVSAIFLRGAGPGGTDWALRDVTTIDPTQINATVPAGAVAGGPYDLVLRTMGGCEVVLPRAYTVQNAPSLTVSQVIPPFGWTGSTTPVTILGDRFQSTPQAYLVVPSRTPRMVRLSRTVFVNANTLTSVVPAGLPVGTYDLVVINPDGGGGLLPMAFRVTMHPPPTIESITPSQGTTQNATPVTITGSHFRSPVTITITSGGMTFMPSGVMVSADGTSITATFPTNTMPAGSYVVRVTNTDENTYAEYGPFVVTNPARKLETFSTTEPLRVARRGLGAASGRINSANRFVYAVGGDTGGASPTVLDSVEFAQIDIRGALSPWRVQRYRLNTARTRLGLVRQGRYLYAIGGGSSGVTPTPLGSVERAYILGFEDAPVISDPMVRRVSGAGLAAGSWLYVVSAIKNSTDPNNPDGETLPSDEVVATLVSTGTVTLSWMPVAGARAYRVYRTPMVNGASGTEVLLADNVMETTFTDDGTRMPAMPTPETTPLRVGSTGRWVTVGSLVHPRDGAAVAIAPDPGGNLFVYAIGGAGSCTGMGSPAPMNCYEFASISADGRTLGAWTAGSTTFSVPRTLACAPVATSITVPGLTPSTAAYVFLTGGFNSPSTSTNAIERATVQMGGELGSFVSTMPTIRTYGGTRGGPACSIINSAFFAIGGSSGGTPFTAALNTNVAAELNNNGGFAGPFSSTAGSMSVPHALHGLAEETGYFYIIGGTSSGTDAITTVERVIH